MERGLRELAADTASGSLCKAISAVAAELESGKSIEEAFGTHSRGFPPLYSEVLRAGVSSGRLGQALNDLNRRLEFSRQTRRIVFEALAYPAVVLALATIVLTAVLAVVVPHFEPFLADFSGRLPLLTRMLFGVSHHLVQAWMFIGALAAAAVVSGILLGQSAAGQRFKEACLLKLPVSGGIRRNTILSRLADAMALLVESGCDLPSCLRLGGAATPGEAVRRRSPAKVRNR